MTHDFTKNYWEEHWRHGEPVAMEGIPPNPYLVNGTSSLTPGTALDAGCGAGAEAIWLATQGWQVTAADISSDALARASRRAIAGGLSQQVEWVEADLTVWSPAAKFDLVTTHYAHPSIPQLDFYKRISNWVAPGGTLLTVGHLHPDGSTHTHESVHTHESIHTHESPHTHKSQHTHRSPNAQDSTLAQGSAHGHEPSAEHSRHEHQPPAEASATVAGISAVLDETRWDIVTTDELLRTLTGPGGKALELRDVVVQATRRP